MERQEVDALYITVNGSTFDHKAYSPHENFITLRWANSKTDQNEDDIVLEFVYFGAYKNKMVYHDIGIEEKSRYLH